MNLKINSLILGCALSCSMLLGQESSFETPARRWIAENSRTLGIQDYSQLKLSLVRKGNSGETLRFQQMIKEVPVFKSEVVVHFNKKGKITYTSESLKNIDEIITTPSVLPSEALKKAHEVSKSSGEIIYEETKLFVYVTDQGDTRLIYRVMTNSFDNPGDWETIIDAQNGEVISVEDSAVYHKEKDHEKPAKKSKKEVETKKTILSTGSAYIYDPDPLSKMLVQYGGQYADGSDQTNASLDAARSLVTIPELELAAGVYKLKGSYVEIADLESPATGLFTQTTNQFLFNRNDQGFEAANAYWHLDHNLRYINQTLGIACVPMQNNGILKFDPHGVNAADNSHYVPTTQILAFGEGGVDDAEDADVIIHELGHGIHDWLTGGNLSRVQGLGEGTGDYWASSYSRSLNQWQNTNAEYNWVFNWDGHNSFWNGRITNYTATYPGGLTGSIHTDGQIWSTSLMRIFDRIGKEKTDRAFLEGLSMTNSTTNQQNAAIAVRQAAIDMLGTFGFTCSDITAITEEFTATGYILPAYTCTLAVNEATEKDIFSIYPNPVSDILKVTAKINKDVIAEIYNMEGRKVLQTTLGNGKNTINVSNLHVGSYILRIKDLEISTKFIKK